MTDENNKILFYLHELSDYKVADDYSDIRNWPVQDLNNRIIGTVDGLLVNKNAQRVVYVDVEVDQDLITVGHETYAAKASEGMHEYLNKDSENHLIIPVGMIDINTENEVVIAREINYETFAKTSRYKKGTSLTREYERMIYESYAPFSREEKTQEQVNADDIDFYSREGFMNRRNQPD